MESDVAPPQVEPANSHQSSKVSIYRHTTGLSFKPFRTLVAAQAIAVATALCQPSVAINWLPSRASTAATTPFHSCVMARLLTLGLLRAVGADKPQGGGLLQPKRGAEAAVLTNIVTMAQFTVVFLLFSGRNPEVWCS